MGLKAVLDVGRVEERVGQVGKDVTKETSADAKAVACQLLAREIGKGQETGGAEGQSGARGEQGRGARKGERATREGGN